MFSSRDARVYARARDIGAWREHHTVDIHTHRYVYIYVLYVSHDDGGGLRVYLHCFSDE